MTHESPTAQKYKRGENPRSRANLIPFKPGDPNRPQPPQGPQISPRIKFLLTLSADEIAAWRPKTVADVIAWRYVQEAMAGGLLSEKGRQEVLERVDGKVPDKIEVSLEPPAVASLRQLQERLREAG